MSKIFDKKEVSDFTDKLQKLGLGEKEALVYLALLRLGETGSSAIIRATELHGQYVYTALGKLEEKELVQHAIKRGRKKFSAKHPQTLARLISEQKRIAEELNMELAQFISLPPEQKFEVFQGEESYVAHEFDLLNEAPSESELLVIGGEGDQFAKAMGKRLAEYETVRLKKKISVRYIGSGAQREALAESKEKRQLFNYRMLPGLFTGQVNTNIWQNAIGFNVFGSPITSFTVYNPTIAGSYRQFFETLWKLGKE